MTNIKVYLLVILWSVIFLAQPLRVVAQNDTIPEELLSGDIVETNASEHVHSPHKASFYAAILPGLGQIYNKKYWKLPLVYGGIAGVGYAIHFNSTHYKNYSRAYRDFVIRDPNNTSFLKYVPPGVPIEDIYGKHSAWFQNALKNRKNYFRRYRDMSYIGMGLLYAAQIIDAAVDAHFFNFDVSDDLSLNLKPTLLHSDYGYNSLGMSLSLNFK